MDEQVVWVERFELKHHISRALAEVQVAHFSRIRCGYHRVTHFPDSQWSSLKELFDSDLLVLVEAAWSSAILRHSYEDCLLDLLVHKLLFIAPIQQLSIANNFWSDSFTYLHLEDGV